VAFGSGPGWVWAQALPPELPLELIFGGAGALLALVMAAAYWRRASVPAITDEASPVPPGLADRLRERMAATRAALQGQLERLFSGPVDESALQALEDALIVADVGVAMTERLLGSVRQRLRAGERDPNVLREVLRTEMRTLLRGVHAPLAEAPPGRQLVILVVGVNGSGKTTTIGKLAARHQAAGRSVVLAAADTYRAAAADQLAIWGERSGARLVRDAEGADPAAVVFKALEVGRSADVILVDTAGRLQNKRPLMDQLGKIRRVMEKALGRGPDETLLVIDGTMGQNALSQAKAFHEATPLTGVVVTKLDGTAKGGILLAIGHELNLPVKLIGIGERMEDLRDFEPDAFVDALT
jgi:fused signal recognition particle receptor